MADTYFVYSTLSQDNLYTFYHPSKTPGAKPSAEARAVSRQILIKGGTGVPNRNLITKTGTVTKITAEEYKLLMGDNPNDERSGCYQFKQHIKNGFIHVDQVKAKPANVAKDMTARDSGAVATLEEIHKRGAPEAKPKE